MESQERRMSQAVCQLQRRGSLGLADLSLEVLV